MPKVLLSRLPDVIATTLAALRDGQELAANDGIIARVLENAVAFQVEVIIDVNGIDRKQVQSTLGATRTTSGGAQVSTQVSSGGVTTGSVTGVDTNVDTGTESSTERSTSTDDTTAHQTSASSTRVTNDFNT